MIIFHAIFFDCEKKSKNDLIKINFQLVDIHNTYSIHVLNTFKCVYKQVVLMTHKVILILVLKCLLKSHYLPVCIKCKITNDTEDSFHNKLAFGINEI